MANVNEITLGASLRQLRASTGLSVRTAAARAGIAPMYLSLLERDACNPPSDEKLQSLAEVLGEPHIETLFAKAGRVTPQVVNTILRCPTPWSELIAAAKDLDADHLAGLKTIVDEAAGRAQFLLLAAKWIADQSVAGTGSKRKQKSKMKVEAQRDTKERAATSVAARVASVRRVRQRSSAVQSH